MFRRNRILLLNQQESKSESQQKQPKRSNSSTNMLPAFFVASRAESHKNNKQFTISINFLCFWLRDEHQQQQQHQHQQQLEAARRSEKRE